jgi:inward rectifier potassium channel
LVGIGNGQKLRAMASKRKPRLLTPAGADYHIRVLGERRRPLRDFYHALLELTWPATIGVIAGGYLGANGLFALGFLCTGGLAHAHAGSFADAFYFSVQTMGTIGYGAIYPETTAANLLTVGESLTGLTLTALATGLVFAKFSRPSARVVFSRHAVIHPHNGVPTLMVRLGNERGNNIVDAQLRMALSLTGYTAEGEMFYQTVDLRLTRERAFSLSRSWTLLHPINADSPLHGQTPESLEKAEAELYVMVVGLDDTSMQVMHASHIYYARDLLWGHKHADVLTALENGNLVLDLHKFHDTQATERSEGFPYPRA